MFNTGYCFRPEYWDMGGMEHCLNAWWDVPLTILLCIVVIWWIRRRKEK